MRICKINLSIVDVSVLIPARGKCPYIAATLQSVLDNEVLCQEVLIIDDGIDEETIQLLRNIETQLEIQIIKNKGAGLVDALNTGLAAAKSSLIARIDSDDLMSPSRIGIQAQFLGNNLLVDVVGSNCEYIDINSRTIGFSNYPVGRVDNLDEFKVKCLVAHPSVMFRKSKAIEVGGYRKMFQWNEIVVAEDFDLWLRMAKQGKIVNLKENLTKYRQHPAQISASNIGGQIIGSNYISAINMQTSPNAPVIKFTNNISSQCAFMLKCIFLNLGIRSFLFTLFKLVQEKNQDSKNIIWIYLNKIGRTIFH